MRALDIAGHVVEAAGLPSDKRFIMESVCDALLVAAANGQLDLNQMAREELAMRGLDHAGKWVGFKRAAQLTAA